MLKPTTLKLVLILSEEFREQFTPIDDKTVDVIFLTKKGLLDDGNFDLSLVNKGDKEEFNLDTLDEHLSPHYALYLNESDMKSEVKELVDTTFTLYQPKSTKFSYKTSQPNSSVEQDIADIIESVVTQ